MSKREMEALLEHISLQMDRISRELEKADRSESPVNVASESKATNACLIDFSTVQNPQDCL